MIQAEQGGLGLTESQGPGIVEDEDENATGNQN